MRKGVTLLATFLLLSWLLTGCAARKVDVTFDETGWIDPRNIETGERGFYPYFIFTVDKPLNQYYCPRVALVGPRKCSMDPLSIGINFLGDDGRPLVRGSYFSLYYLSGDTLYRLPLYSTRRGGWLECCADAPYQYVAISSSSVDARIYHWEGNEYIPPIDPKYAEATWFDLDYAYAKFNFSRWGWIFAPNSKLRMNKSLTRQQMIEAFYPIQETAHLEQLDRLTLPNKPSYRFTLISSKNY